MPFYPPENCNSLPTEPPDSVTVEEFMLNDKYGRRPLAKSPDPFVCALSGLSYSASKVKERTEWLSRAISKEMGWKASSGSEYDKVAAIYTVNNIDYHTVSWAVHRLGGISSPANATYNAHDLAYQLKASKATCLFTSLVNLDVALDAASQVNIPRNKIFLYILAPQITGDKPMPKEFKTVDQLIEEGEKLPEVPAIKLAKGEGKTRVAFLCFSSGTSGLPKGVMIPHISVIANTLMSAGHDLPYRKHLASTGKVEDWYETKLGLLPYSHIYGLVVITQLAMYMGDTVVVLASFNLDTFLSSIQKYKMTSLYVVPPMVIALTKNKAKVRNFDLSSVRTIMSGAAPMGKETGDDLQGMFPNWLIRQGYGMTETATLVTYNPFDDIVSGSVGTIIPGASVKIIDPATLKEVTEYGQPGELWVKSLSNTLGYLNNKQASEETFVTDEGGYWVRTGDEGMVQKSPKGRDHVWILDRIKELIKVKGHQVAPAELEALLLTHPSVADATVIPIPDDRAGERPKAFVVKSQEVGLEDNESMLKRNIMKFVEKQKSEYKWIKEVEFIDAVPRNPSGKILRRMLRDKEKEKRRKAGAKL